MSAGSARLLRLAAAGRAGTMPSPDDWIAHAGAIERLLDGAPVEQAFQLPPGWLGWVRADARRRLQGLDTGKSARAAASALRRQLVTYFPRFEADRRNGGARRPDDSGAYRLIFAFNGRIPSVETLRKLKNPARSVG